MRYLCWSCLLLVVSLSLSSYASGSEEEYAVWSRVAIQCEACGKAGDVAIEATVNEGAYRSMKITAFGREHVLDGKAAEQLAGFPLSSIRVTHEAGYPRVGGYSVHLRLKRLIYDEKKTLVEERALLTVCEEKPGEVSVLKARKPVKQNPAPTVLKELVYVDMYASGSQHPLMCIEGGDFPGGHEMLFRKTGSKETIHVVFPAGAKLPGILDGSLVLRGHYQGIVKRDRFTMKRPPKDYRYFVVASWEYVK